VCGHCPPPHEVGDLKAGYHTGDGQWHALQSHHASLVHQDLDIRPSKDNFMRWFLEHEVVLAGPYVIIQDILGQ